MYPIKELFGINNSLFNETGKPIYMNSDYYKNHFYKFLNTKEKKKRNESFCMFPGCSKKSIKKSHVIPENSVLSLLKNDKNMLAYPFFDITKGVYIFKMIGVKNASTFPGFCSEHENIFHFEKNQDFTDSSIVYQNYRVICRDLFFYKNQLNILENELNRYKKEVFDYHNSLLEKAKGITIRKDFELISIEDEHIKSGKKKIDFLKNMILVIQRDYLNPYFEEKEEENQVVTIIFKIDFFVPVALAGRSDFGYMNQNNTKVIYGVCLSIFPSVDSTTLIFSLKRKHVKYFSIALSRLNGDLGYLNFIESWMIFATDYWFINEETIKNWSNKKKEKICGDLLDMNHYPTSELSYSIFDDLRKKIIKKGDGNSKEMKKIMFGLSSDLRKRG